MAQLLETVEFESGSAPRAAVIWMHGLGADGHDFAPIVPELDLPAALSVRFVFPHAPMRPVTMNQGWVMRAWYDIVDDVTGRREHEPDVRASHAAIDDLIAREATRGIPPARLVLAGFSQGGAMALHVGLRHPARLAGIMALSGFLPLAGTLAAEATAVSRTVPIFMAHGRDDDVLPLARGARARDALAGLGYTVEWHDYRMAHAVCPEEIRDIGAWLARVLSRTEEGR